MLIFCSYKLTIKMQGVLIMKLSVHTFLILVLIISFGSSYSMEVEKSQGPNLSRRYYTELHSAATNGEVAKMETLLTNNANVHYKYYSGYTPLHLAAQYGKRDAVDFLINFGAYIEFTDDEFQETPLHLAAREGHHAVIDALMKHGAKLEALNHKMNTPLHKAAREDKLEAVQALVGYGANKKARNIDGNSAYDYAYQRGHAEVADFLESSSM